LGIDADELPKMFQRYYRARTSSGIAGTGIGLNLVRQIVEMHGGVIALASVKGKGSTFTVQLPIAGKTGGMVAAQMTPSKAEAA
jgi:signal transduction histidine kinase